MVFSGARFLVSRTCRALGGPLESLNGIGMKSLRTCFFSSSVFDQPKTSRHHCFSSVRFLARKICGAIVFSVALLALELQFSLAFFWCLMFLFFCWKLLVFFHFGFLAVGTKSSCSIRSCQAKHKKTSGFLPRPDPILQALEKSSSVFFISFYSGQSKVVLYN